ncbi:tyrosine-type recombinase/integrase [Sphingomonas elodea]|uniref:tyrosine-type recombinase/integrase n=1 Tax=Sphingomonas elodea TaxID=179878 RepID=UPI00026321EC|nr:site-specific integrase [Sphingomonas elodea]
MSVYKPGKSPYYHYDFVWNGRRFHGSTGLKAKREALAFEARVRSDAILQIREREPITVDLACGLYQDHAEKQTSWQTTRYILQSAIDGLGAGKLLKEITQLDLQRHFAARRATRSNATINREIETLRAVWRRADDAGFDVGDMPRWTSLFLRVAERPPRELSLDEEPRLFEAMRADLVDVCDFALKSGWRQAEVIGLRWSDIDMHNRTAQTRIKGGDIVRRPLTATLIAIIANQPKVGPFVFTFVAQANKSEVVDKKGRRHPARKKGERYPMTKTALRGAFAAAKIDAKIEGFRFHDLRHTRGTRIVRATGSLAAAKEALKHRNIKTTLRYAHVLDEDVRNALDASESRTIPEPKREAKQKG